MRIQKPQPFDPSKEYKISERCIYNGMVLVLTKWIQLNQKDIVKYKLPMEMVSRCLSCRVHDICKGPHLQCDKFNRSDRKNTFWKFLRITEGYQAKQVFSYSFDGSISGVKVEAVKKD